MAEQQVMVIFGASSGLGRAAAVKAANMGWHIVVVGRNAAALAQLTEQIGGQFAVADIRDEAAVSAALAGIAHIDHVVITSGTVPATPIVDSDMAQLRLPFEERVIGTMHVVRAAAPKMTQGSFTFITGDLADRPRGQYCAVSAAAAAVEVMAKSWVQELAPLRFNIISPGVVDTELQEKLMGDYKASFMESVVAQIPVGHVGHRDHIADAVMGLVQNPFVNGAVLNVDGGMRHVG